MRTIAIINLKGGVAKTTSSINIAYILTQRGYKVLLVDNDKQGDCSRGLNRRTQDGEGIDRIMVDRHRLSLRNNLLVWNSQAIFQRFFHQHLAGGNAFRRQKGV